MKLIKYVETVEVPTNSTTKTKFYFAEQPNLRNKRILYINTFGVWNTTKSPSNLTLINSTVFQKSFLVLVAKNKEVVNRFPLRQFVPNYQQSKGALLDLIIDFPKSYIEIGSIASLSATETFLLTFYCNDYIKDEPEYRSINVENIEVETTPATIQKFHFPDHENLRGKRIQFIEYLDPTITMSPSGGSIVNSTVRMKSYLTLTQRGQEIIRKIPLFIIISDPATGYRIPFDNIEIDFPNSYFEVASTSGIVAGEKFFLNIFFYDHVTRKKN